MSRECDGEALSDAVRDSVAVPEGADTEWVLSDAVTVIDRVSVPCEREDDLV